MEASWVRAFLLLLSYMFAHAEFDPTIWITDPHNNEIRNHSTLQVKFGIDGFEVPNDGLIRVKLDDGKPYTMEDTTGAILLRSLANGPHVVELALLGHGEDLETGDPTATGTAAFRVRMAPPVLQVLHPIPNSEVTTPNVPLNFTLCGYKIPYDGYLEVFVDDGPLPDRRKHDGNFFVPFQQNGEHVVKLRLVDSWAMQVGSNITIPFTVAAPRGAMQITSPTQGQVYMEEEEEIVLTTDVLGDYRVPDHGFLHVTLNDERVFVFNHSGPITIEDLPDGVHFLKVGMLDRHLMPYPSAECNATVYFVVKQTEMMRRARGEEVVPFTTGHQTNKILKPSQRISLMLHHATAGDKSVIRLTDHTGLDLVKRASEVYGNRVIAVVDNEGFAVPRREKLVHIDTKKPFTVVFVDEDHPFDLKAKRPRPVLPQPTTEPPVPSAKGDDRAGIVRYKLSHPVAGKKAVSLHETELAQVLMDRASQLYGRKVVELLDPDEFPLAPDEQLINADSARLTVSPACSLGIAVASKFTRPFSFLL